MGGAIKIRRINKETEAWKKQFDAFYEGCHTPKVVDGLPHAYFAAYAGKELAGHCVIYLEDGKWIMDGLRVDPAFRERGIGKKLTAERIRYAITQGAKEIWYSCHDDNLVTICCHVRFGFEKICPAHHHCNAATAHWYRLKVTPSLCRKLSSSDPK